MLLLALTAAFAQDAAPDVSLTWTEPTCADEALTEAASRRSASVCGAAKVARTTFSYRPSRAVAGCEVWLSAWCADGPKAAFQAAGTVTVPTAYPDKAWAGVALALSPGTFDLTSIPFPGGGTWADRVDSLRVPAGWTVRACHEPRGMGRCTDLVADHPELGTTYVGGDDAASLQVERGGLAPLWPCPRVFMDDGFKGKLMEVCADMPDLTGGEWNDRISSVIVPPGWTVELCANPRFEAPCKETTLELARITGGVLGPDQATSIRVTKP
jgi:hypothetical protein